ncbi:MAG TPA: 2-amino-4-hydroxy-6-hydroxymethyldihydropteridine diphosphokinase, partial [Candidatus Babeliales bacterium]|nr:2-amino-4-hydroxy-6-hydroxymethyldihydropteridine diphosphokinase [Candidatus Babeliales bacterium]
MIIFGLGCNIGDRLSNLRDALAQIRLIPEIKVHQVSPVYESDALLPENAPRNWNQPYLNLALSLTTKLKPEQLLIKIKTIEEEMGRISGLRWSPRVMDIDILAWDEECYQTDNLKIPHLNLT